MHPTVLILLAESGTDSEDKGVNYVIVIAPFLPNVETQQLDRSWHRLIAPAIAGLSDQADDWDAAAIAALVRLRQRADWGSIAIGP